MYESVVKIQGEVACLVLDQPLSSSNYDMRTIRYLRPRFIVIRYDTFGCYGSKELHDFVNSRHIPKSTSHSGPKMRDGWPNYINVFFLSSGSDQVIVLQQQPPKETRRR
jgi:hypothetical protein